MVKDLMTKSIWKKYHQWIDVKYFNGEVEQRYECLASNTRSCNDCEIKDLSSRCTGSPLRDWQYHHRYIHNFKWVHSKIRDECDTCEEIAQEMVDYIGKVYLAYLKEKYKPDDTIACIDDIEEEGGVC